MNHRDAERERLMKELTQLEEEAHALDLRDRIGWEAHQRRIEIMRARIATYEKARQRRGT